jgi:hypothetical protein
MGAKLGTFRTGIAVSTASASSNLCGKKSQALGKTDPDEPAEAANLACPICHDTAVVFHSEISVPFAETAEPSAIFICSASHTFLVPYCTLDQPRPRVNKIPQPA